MRTWISAGLVVAVAGWFAASAQPPAEPPKGPPPIEIRPKGSGATPAAPKAPPGTIVISPNGKAPVGVSPAFPGTVVGPGGTTSPGSPANPPVAGMPVGGQPLPQPAPPARADGKLVYDYWYLAAVEGQPLGYLHWEAREVEMKGQKFLVGTKYQTFTVRRINDVVTQWGEESTVETPDGEVLNTTVRQGLGKNQALVISGWSRGRR
jgi:hypothetical protein